MLTSGDSELIRKYCLKLIPGLKGVLARPKGFEYVYEGVFSLRLGDFVDVDAVGYFGFTVGHAVEALS